MNTPIVKTKEPSPCEPDRIVSPTTKTADVVVIGTGPGGYVAAIRLAQLGKKVIAIEREAIGGVCLNWGCIPSKAMIHASSLLESMGKADDMGISVSGVALDMGKMKTWKDGIVSRLTGGIAELFKRNGIEYMSGNATFVGEGHIMVANAEGETFIKTQHTLVATGARPRPLPALDFDGERVVTSKEALDFTEPPKNFLCVGGGIVGCEIGTYMAKLGSKVTIVELADTLLAGTDPELTKVVQRGMKKRKIDVYLNSKVAHVEHKQGQMEVVITTPKGDKAVPADKILVAIGFIPNTEGLGLETVGVELDDRGHIKVDERLVSSNPKVSAIGDVIGAPYLAHKASKEGMVAAEVIAGLNVVLDVKAMPSAIFTDPEIASVGMTESEAEAAGHKVKTGSFPMAANGRALSTNHPDGLVKFVADADDDTLLGVHICSHEASDLISEAALAIEMGATVEDIGLTVHPHPTLSETLMEAAHVVSGHAIHIFSPK